jgi:hypothetical protein
MTWKEFRLRLKSRRRRLVMWFLDATCSEHIVSITTDQLLDLNVAESSETRLSIEFRIYRHVYRYGKGSRGLTTQFNISQVDCVRHYLDGNLRYIVVSETHYGLSPDEYFYVVKQKISRLGKDTGGTDRLYVKKRKSDL